MIVIDKRGAHNSWIGCPRKAKQNAREDGNTNNKKNVSDDTGCGVHGVIT